MEAAKFFVQTYPSPKSTLTLTSHLEQNVGLGEGEVGSFPEAYDYPFVLTESSQIFLKGYRSASLIYRMAPISLIMTHS